MLFKKLFVKTVVFVTFLCASENIQCFINRVSVWKHGNFHVFNCHDIHNYSELLNKDQINTFQQIIPQLDDALLIIENQPVSVAVYRAKNLFNTAAEIQDLFLKHFFRAQEADFRMKLTRSYYKCLAALSSDNEMLKNHGKELVELGLTTKAVAYEFEDAFNRAKHLIDVTLSQQKISPTLADMFYQICDNAKNDWCDELEAWKQFEGSLLGYCDQKKCFNAQYLNQSLHFATHLLDVLLFLAIVNSDKKIIFIISGSVHARTIEYFLKCACANELASQGELLPALVGIKLPSDIPIEKSTHYFMTADELYLQSGQRIHAVPAEFFKGILNPVVYA